MKLHVYLSLKITLEFAQPMTPYLFLMVLQHGVIIGWMGWLACQDPLCCSGPLGKTVTEGMRRVFRLWFSCWISSSCFSYILTAWVNRMIPKSKWNILSICSLCTGFLREISRNTFSENLKLNHYWFYHFLISLNSDPQCSCLNDMLLQASDPCSNIPLNRGILGSEFNHW